PVNETMPTPQKPRPGVAIRVAGERFETCRMFENDFLEKFSHIHPATPFVVWIPAIVYMLYRSWARQDLAVSGMVVTFASGLLLWTLMEYLLHRYVFHWVNETSWGKRVHFLFHGVHNDFPKDATLRVMPLLT